ncbi:MAG TPA: serine/threonine-protein kinase [Dehalococcoidia bacterium]|jgi:serine/threonine protein kinase|nr:serine/threonine-protein kinase [Dehalococcoidia bacterium]
MPHQVGERIDHYEILQPLGEGGFASTYLARDERSGQQVVLKWPDESLLGDQTVFEHFRREMAITRRLRHPNIQAAVDEGESRSAPYLILEYIEGTPLHRLLRERGKLSVEETVAIARQLASALAYIHEQQVYHRDLKPENVLVTPDGTAKIIDFGIALMQGARRMTWRWLTNATGTPAYMAPEQIQGKRGDARTDIYALGIMMYEMLKGRAPYGRPGDDPLAVMQQHLSALPDALPGNVPPGLAGIIAKAMRRNPDERYQSAEELLADLDRYEQLTAADFQFPEERDERVPNADRRLILLGLAMAGGFIALVAVVIGVVVLVQSLR